jgi:hypothetical protein
MVDFSFSDLLARPVPCCAVLCCAALQTSTRLISFREGGHLIPLIDMANHQDGCKHTVAIKSCDSTTDHTTKPSDKTPSSSSSGQGGLNNSQLCVVWTAGADVAAGEQVCIPSGRLLLPDTAMLQYGFIPQHLATATQQQQQQQEQQGPETSGVSGPVPLFGMDRHDFKELSNGELPWRFGLSVSTNLQPFAGEPDPYDEISLVHDVCVTHIQLLWCCRSAAQSEASSSQSFRVHWCTWY